MQIATKVTERGESPLAFGEIWIAYDERGGAYRRLTQTSPHLDVDRSPQGLNAKGLVYGRTWRGARSAGFSVATRG